MCRDITVTVKYEDSLDDGFSLFMYQMRESHQLSTLIMNLLHVYYENEELRKIVSEMK